MPNTTAEHMRMIADDLWNEGLYTRAHSVEAITAERDALQARLEELGYSLPWARGLASRLPIRHWDAITRDVPEGYDTVLGYLAKHHPDILDLIDRTDPDATARDGWWLSHRCKDSVQQYVLAPECLRAAGIKRVRLWPIALMAQRWGRP